MATIRMTSRFVCARNGVVTVGYFHDQVETLRREAQTTQDAYNRAVDEVTRREHERDEALERYLFAATALA